MDQDQDHIDWDHLLCAVQTLNERTVFPKEWKG